jgi:Spy/CpxP family protein refolding chaperone
MAAPPPQGPPPQGPPPQGPPLTDEQRTKLQALATEQRDRLHAARDQTQKLQEQMRAEVWADKPDEAKIKQLRGDLAKAQQEMFAARLDFQTRRAQVFTPEQRKQIRDLQARRQARDLRGFARPGQRFGPAARGFRGGMRGFRRPGPWDGAGMGWWGQGFRRPLPPGRGYGPGRRWWEDEP